LVRKKGITQERISLRKEKSIHGDTHPTKELVRRGKKAAVATVIQKQGSALRGVGSKMGISSEMEMVGSVSGGCVEGAVVQEVLKTMNSGRTSFVDYGISDDLVWSVGLACGGQV